MLNKLNNDCILQIIKCVADDEDKDDRRANLRNLSRICTALWKLRYIELYRDLPITTALREYRARSEKNKEGTRNFHPSAHMGVELHDREEEPLTRTNA